MEITFREIREFGESLIILDARHKGHILKYRHMGIERVVLKDHGYVTVFGRNVVNNPVAYDNSSLCNLLHSSPAIILPTAVQICHLRSICKTPSSKCSSACIYWGLSIMLAVLCCCR